MGGGGGVLGMCVCMCIMCGCVFSGELKWVKLIFMTASKKLLRFYILRQGCYGYDLSRSYEYST